METRNTPAMAQIVTKSNLVLMESESERVDVGGGLVQSLRSIPNPPEGGILVDGVRVPAETAEEVVREVNAFGKAHGFGIIREKASNYRLGEPTYIQIHCDRGRSRPSRSAGIRSRKTKKLDCPWMGVVQATQKNNWKWTFRYTKNHERREHNHDPSFDLSDHYAHSRFNDEQKNLIETLSKDPDMRPKDIIKRLLQNNPNAVVTEKQIRNLQQSLRRKKFSTMNLMQSPNIGPENRLQTLPQEPYSNPLIENPVYQEPQQPIGPSLQRDLFRHMAPKELEQPRRKRGRSVGSKNKPKNAVPTMNPPMELLVANQGGGTVVVEWDNLTEADFKG